MSNVEAHYARKRFHAKRRQARLNAWDLHAMPTLSQWGIVQHTPYHYSIKLQVSNINRPGPVYYDRIQIYPSTLKYVWKGTTCDLDIRKFLKFCSKRLPPESERDKPTQP